MHPPIPPINKPANPIATPTPIPISGFPVTKPIPISNPVPIIPHTTKPPNPPTIAPKKHPIVISIVLDAP